MTNDNKKLQKQDDTITFNVMNVCTKEETKMKFCKACFSSIGQEYNPCPEHGEDAE